MKLKDFKHFLNDLKGFHRFKGNCERIAKEFECFLIECRMISDSGAVFETNGRISNDVNENIEIISRISEVF